MQALDKTISGVCSFDLKENVDGVPCITEINAGRFAMITSIYDLTGKYNMAVTYVRLALGDRVDISDPYDIAEDYYLVRDLDTEPGVFRAQEFFEGIRNSRGRESPTTDPREERPIMGIFTLQRPSARRLRLVVRILHEPQPPKDARRKLSAHREEN